MGKFHSGRWAFANHEFWTKPIALILTLSAIVFIIGLIRWAFFDSDITALLIEGIIVAAVMTMGLLKAFYPKFGNIVDKGFTYYFYGTFLYFALVGPFVFFLFVAKWTVNNAGPFFQYLIFILSILFWFMLLATITHEPWKRWLFNRLKNLGWLLPLIFLINFVMISVVLFGSIGYLINCKPVAPCTIPGIMPSEVNYDSFLSWFLWHVVDAIPAVKITQTLSWAEPLKIAEGPTWLGLWLVAFKIAVIVPGIGAFKAYWNRRKAEGKEPITAG